MSLEIKENTYLPLDLQEVIFLYLSLEDLLPIKKDPEIRRIIDRSSFWMRRLEEFRILPEKAKKIIDPQKEYHDLLTNLYLEEGRYFELGVLNITLDFHDIFINRHISDYREFLTGSLVAGDNLAREEIQKYLDDAHYFHAGLHLGDEKIIHRSLSSISRKSDEFTASYSLPSLYREISEFYLDIAAIYSSEMIDHLILFNLRSLESVLWNIYRALGPSFRRLHLLEYLLSSYGTIIGKEKIPEFRNKVRKDEEDALRREGYHRPKYYGPSSRIYQQIGKILDDYILET